MSGARTASLVGLTILSALLAACAGAEPGDTVAQAQATLAPPSFVEDNEVPSPPAFDGDRVLAGALLYEQHCAVCHKADLSGEPGWMIPNDDGTYKPPPQDSTGHTWHHADQLLIGIVRDGNANPIATMPTFAGILTDQEILDVLEFFKAQWGEDERLFQWEVTWRAGQEGG